MRSSIFSFDLWPLVKGASGAVVTLAAAWIAFPSSKLPFDETSAFGARAMNELTLERYTFEGLDKPIVFVGSSVTTLIPTPPCRPDNVASIYLQGGGPATGLEAIIRTGGAPKLVFVDIQGSYKEVDYDLLNTAIPPLWWRVRAAIPPLRAHRNLIMMAHRSIFYQRTDFQMRVAQYPQQSLAEWNEEVAPRTAVFLVESVLPDSALRPTITGLAKQIREIQARGARIVFFAGMDPRIRRKNPTKEIIDYIAEALPDVPIVTTDDDQYPIYRTDGIHITVASGLEFFNYLMAFAGAPYVAKCELGPLPVQKVEAGAAAQIR